MKFVILIWSNPESRALWEKIPPEHRVVGLQDYAALNDDLEQSGETGRERRARATRPPRSG